MIELFGLVASVLPEAMLRLLAWAVFIGGLMGYFCGYSKGYEDGVER